MRGSNFDPVPGINLKKEKKINFKGSYCRKTIIILVCYYSLVEIPIAYMKHPNQWNQPDLGKRESELVYNGRQSLYNMEELEKIIATAEKLLKFYSVKKL